MRRFPFIGAQAPFLFVEGSPDSFHPDTQLSSASVAEREHQRRNIVSLHAFHCSPRTQLLALIVAQPFPAFQPSLAPDSPSYSISRCASKRRRPAKMDAPEDKQWVSSQSGSLPGHHLARHLGWHSWTLTDAIICSHSHHFIILSTVLCAVRQLLLPGKRQSHLR